MSARPMSSDTPDRRYDIAIRPDDPDIDPMDYRTQLDDIVVCDVEMFRAEDLGDGWWVCCYLRNGDRISWNVSAKCRPRRLSWTTSEYPDGVVYEHDLEDQ